MNPLLKEMRSIINENEKLKQANELLRQQTVSAKEVEAMKAYIAKLEAQVGEAHEITAPIPTSSQPKKCLREIIQPLHVKRGYTGTRIPGSLYTEVYSHMNVEWEAIIIAYVQSHSGVCYNNIKTIIVEANPELVAEFERVVNILLAE